MLPQFAGGGTLHGGTCIECLNPPDPDCWQEALQCIGCPDAGAPRLFIECTGVPDDTGETIFVYDGRCYIIQHEAAEVTTLPAGAVELPTIPVDTYVSCLACCEAIDVDCSDCSTPPCLDDPFTVITNGWTATDPDCNCTWTPVAVDIHPSDSTACSMSATEDAGGTPLSQGYTICCPPPPTCDPVDETNLDSISLSCATDGGAGPYWTMTLRYFVTEVGGGGAPLDWVYRKADIDQCPTGTYSVLIEQPDEFQICSPFTSDSAPSLGFTGP
ncbi:MAG: hypothetical protein KJO36_06115 [Acidimicrobiia bacterium]|nr:hypothetical protein [Acidimicrobiia bacterium]